MSDDMTARLEAMLEKDAQSPMLQFALAQRYYDAGRAEDAARHAALAVELNADYSAAWRLLGRAQAAAGRHGAAIAAFERGIEVAARLGDKQAEKEMRVFLKRATRQSG